MRQVNGHILPAAQQKMSFYSTLEDVLLLKTVLTLLKKR